MHKEIPRKTIFSSYSVFALLVLFVLLAVPTPKISWAKTAIRQTLPACAKLHFLSTYEEAGLVARKQDGTIVLQLDADLHSADCGTPDCYGTKLTLIMKPVASGTRCVIREVRVRARDYSAAGCGVERHVIKTQQLMYMSQNGQADLNDASLDKLTLRSKDRSHAIVLLKNNFFYYDMVTPDCVMRTRLQTEDDAETKYCWGATSSRLQSIRK